MKILVRIYVPQGDKANIEVKTIEKAYSLLKQTEHNIKQRVKWNNFEDIFFNDTKNYIRIQN
jgi:hypothetical protein